GSTVPFIARYRKEMTGSADEGLISRIRSRRDELEDLEKRRQTVLGSLEDQGVLTPELKKKIRAAANRSELEDMYLPYRPKRKTRASAARDAGLEGLAEIIRAGGDPEKETSRFLNPEKGVETAADALQGAMDIVAETVSEDADLRRTLRDLFRSKGFLSAKPARGRKQEADRYRDYFSYREPVSRAPSHRILAVLRGAGEGLLTVHAEPDEETAIGCLYSRFLKSKSGGAAYLKSALEDAYRRLLAPSLERELLSGLKEKADTDAIDVFAENLREILLEAPWGSRPVLALDPGYRTGCKLTVLDSGGNLLENGTIFPLPPQNDTVRAAEILKGFAERFNPTAVAVGNGTGGREAETFCRETLSGVPVISVNESGASVYSASETARREFPDKDVTVRGAVSIGRRLQDPLAELVKIDPASIGVGQYQHDVDQKKLARALGETVISCVALTGVELNSASRELLSYVPGMTRKTADAVVRRREAQGLFRSREALKAVPGIGEKVFQQAAGFLRVRDSENPLDGSAVHPERYRLVEQMARDHGVTVGELIQNPEARKSVDLQKYVHGDIGLPTLTDIMKELEKPGRDPRSRFDPLVFSPDITEIEDLAEGMVLPGIITNVTDFGAFVDVGVHQDGLIHVSELSDSFVKNPRDVVKVRQRLRVKVLRVDTDRRRISLSLKGI
ncbi:MAG: Tex family protein, partial [Spirochaetia bacterium]